MASGSYADKTAQQLSVRKEVITPIPARASLHQLQAAKEETQETYDYYYEPETRLANPFKGLLSVASQIATVPLEIVSSVRHWINGMIDSYRRNDRWLKPWI